MKPEFNPQRVHEHSYGEISNHIDELQNQIEQWREIAYRTLHNMPLSIELARVVARYLAEKGEIKKGTME